jgi:hypothetical protein
MQTPTTQALDYFIQVTHNGQDFCACLTRGGQDDPFEILRFTVFAATLQSTIRSLSLLLELCDQRWKPEIHLAPHAAYIIDGDLDAQLYLRSLSVPVIRDAAQSDDVMTSKRVEAAAAAARCELVRLGHLEDAAFLETLCAMDEQLLAYLLQCAALANHRGAWAKLRHRCRALAAEDLRQLHTACAA